MLNIMQRMSGIATIDSQVCEAFGGHQDSYLQYSQDDSRSPYVGETGSEDWWRYEAVRIGLFDMILLKDNHIDFAGGIDNAINRCHAS